MRTGCVHYSATMMEKLEDLDPEIYISRESMDLFPQKAHKIPTYRGLISFIFSTILAIPALFIFTIIRFLSQPAYDRYSRKMIFYFTAFHPWNYFLTKFSKLFKIKTIQTIHDFNYHTGEDNKMLKNLKHRTIKNADHLIFLTQTEMQRAINSYPKINDKASVLSHPFLKWPGLKTNNLSFSKKPKLLMLGRMNPYKGLDLFLEAVYPIKERFEKITIAGKIAPNNQISKDVGFDFIDKYLSEEEIAQLLSNHHILVLPYKEATQSGIIPLGIQVGIPMIITDVGGLSEQISKDAAVFVQANAESITEGIIKLTNEENYNRAKEQLLQFKTGFEENWENEFNTFKKLLK